MMNLVCYKTDIKTFDVLTYSDMMFWIEYYNRQLLENALIPMPLDVETIDI